MAHPSLPSSSPLASVTAGAFPLYGTLLLFQALLAVPIVLGEFDSAFALRAGLVVTCAVSVAVSLAFWVWIRAHAASLAQPVERRVWSHYAWALVYAVLVAAAISFSSEAAYAALALWVILLWLLPRRDGVAAVVVLTVGVVLGQAVHHGWTVGGVVGPIVSSIAVIALMLGYRAMVRVAATNAALVAELREVGQALAASERLAGREAERARLGRDLHDTTAQHLSSIRLLLAAAERSKTPAESQRLLAQADALTGQALGEIRGIIHDLSPAELAGVSLTDALERLVAAKRQTLAGPAGSVSLSFEVVGEPREVPSTVGTALLRIAGEALNNALRHGRPSAVATVVTFGPRTVVLEIDDDGCGFDPESLPQPQRDHGHGLPGIRARVAELGGTVGIVSEPGDGTLIRVEIADSGEDR